MSNLELLTGEVIRRAPAAAHFLRRSPLTYLLALALAESAAMFVALPVGMGLHAFLLLALVVQAAVCDRKTDENFFLALAFPPLIRLLSISLPLENLTFWQANLAMAIPLAFSAYLAARVMGLNLASLGLTARGLPWQFLIMLSGLGIGFIAYQLLQPDPLIPALLWKQLWLPGFLILVLTGFLEELIFRGTIQSRAVESFGLWGIPFVATLYAILHIGQGSVLFFGFAWILGLSFGLLARFTHSILGVGLAHGLANICLYLVFPLALRSTGENAVSYWGGIMGVNELGLFVSHLLHAPLWAWFALL